MDEAPLFTPFRLNSISLANRFIMPAMQRGQCLDGRPKPELAKYYRRRVEGGVAMVIGESCAIDHPTATRQSGAARMTADTRDGWAHCVDEVRGAGGHMLIQLWHEGALRNSDDGKTISPSGLVSPGKWNGSAASLMELDALREAYVCAALEAKAIGANGVEVHAAHGYLLDQFLWHGSNLRDDGYGGESIEDRVRFPAEVVRSIRAACGPEFVISFRFSQWKEVDYSARIARDPAELKLLTTTLEESGVDVFHASTRRFWESEWPGDPRGLAGWVKALSGLPVITVGSVGLSTDVMSTFGAETEAQEKASESVFELERRFREKEFDLVAVGRALIGDPDWVNKVRDRQFETIRVFQKSDLGKIEWDSAVLDEAHSG